MKKLNQFFVALIISTLIFSSCLEPVVVDPEEVITTLIYNIQDTSGLLINLKFQDLDGDGGNAPTITGGSFRPNTTYFGSLALINESVSPAEEINAEILAEAIDHQFFFESSISDLTIAYTDQDANNNPLGILTNFTTGAAGSGTLKITLRHQPDKAANGVSDGDITNAGGETDIEVTFDIVIE